MSQMGVVMAAIGFSLAAADLTAPMSAAFYASHHVLAKGALFLAVGVAYAPGARRIVWVMVPVLLLVLSFGGLPFTGGAFAKAATKGQFEEGVLDLRSSLSAAGTKMLMLHFANQLRFRAAEAANASAPTGMIIPWMAMTLAALLLVALGGAMFLASP